MVYKAKTLNLVPVNNSDLKVYKKIKAHKYLYMYNYIMT